MVIPHQINKPFRFAVRFGRHTNRISRQIDSRETIDLSSCIPVKNPCNCINMRTHSRSLLLATATILCITINASPIQDISLASSNSPTNNTTATNARVSCPSSYANADIVTCLKLLVQLPEETRDGDFHIGGIRDAFQLPVSLSESLCRVSVTVLDFRGGLSNWPAVRFAANQIIAACTVGNYPHGLTGGHTTIGSNGNIWVKVTARYPGDLGVA